MTDQERLHGFIVCRSADGWSLHAHDATDEGIACGDDEAFLTGEYDADGEIPAWVTEWAIATRQGRLYVHLDDAS